LRAQAKSVVFYFKEGDGLTGTRKGFVEDQDRGLYSRIWIKHPAGKETTATRYSSTSIFLS
jgi:hypothetical protein